MLFNNAATINTLATPSFANGWASIGNLFPQVTLPSLASDREADTKALASDWSAVGHDLQPALGNYAHSLTRARQK